MGGGSTKIIDSYIHDCAATGIYVGGPGSHALMERTDVLENGNGNKWNGNSSSDYGGQGIYRGHSGLYLEQGVATIKDCNISHNSFTGISTVSPDNAILHLIQSDFVANGTSPLVMPPVGSFSHSRSSLHDNIMVSFGELRSRSALVALSDNPTPNSNTIFQIIVWKNYPCHLLQAAVGKIDG